jgi:hypothetical protein
MHGPWQTLIQTTTDRKYKGWRSTKETNEHEEVKSELTSPRQVLGRKLWERQARAENKWEGKSMQAVGSGRQLRLSCHWLQKKKKILGQISPCYSYGNKATGFVSKIGSLDFYSQCSERPSNGTSQEKEGDNMVSGLRSLLLSGEWIEGGQE